MSNRRVLEPIEAHIALAAGVALAVLAALAVTFPRGFVYPFAAIAGWLAVALLCRGIALRRQRTPRPNSDEK